MDLFADMRPSAEESPYDLDKNHKVNVETHLVM
jgi:hypothetical protein